MSTDRLVSRITPPILLLVVASWISARPIPAQQLGQYKPPGTTAERPGDDRERLEEQMESSLWTVGPLRLSPWIGLTDARFVANAFDTSQAGREETDFTFTVGAGVTGIVPFGSKVYLSLEAVPQYVFWLEQDERNNFNEWYGGTVYGFFNRLYLETSLGRRDAVRRVTSEVDQEANIREDMAEAVAELRLGGAIHLFASAGAKEISSLEDAADLRIETFSALDRQETVYRGGLRYRPRKAVLFGAGIESSKAEFEPGARDLSNSGEYPFAELSWDATKLFVTAEVVFLDLEPEAPTSQFSSISDPRWEAQITFEPGWRFDYSLYGRRYFSYALDEGYGHFQADRTGLRIGATLGERLTAGAFGETGEDEYSPLVPAAAPRTDDVTAWGVDFTFGLTEWLDIQIGYGSTEFDSDTPGVTRENERITLGLAFGSERLALGRR